MSKHETNLGPKISNENLLEIQYQIGRAFRFMPDTTAKGILKNKKEFQKLLQKISKDLSIPFVSENAIRQIPLLEDYFKKVFGLDIPGIAELNFPEHDVFKTLMVVSPKHDEDQIIEAITGYNKVNLFRYKNPIAKNINRDEEQVRPKAFYSFAHIGGDEPDQNHLGKSYDDAMAIKMIFANPKEYLLMTGFHNFTKMHFMDKKGWTRTSSLWSSGGLVYGDWGDDRSELRLGYGNRADRGADDGPRELVL